MWHAAIAMLLIATFFSFVGFVAYELYGPGIHFDIPDYLLPAGWATTTEEMSASGPLAQYRGTLFKCEGDKALKAEFLDGKVNLALSDGRRVRLPEISRGFYGNADGSFVFRSDGAAAFVEEGGARTYADCSAAP